MPNAPFYRTEKWRLLRNAVIRRAKRRCEAPGCTARGIIVDHIVGRRQGGSDTVGNLRLLCRDHDNAIKEDATGKRRGGGDTKGCFPDGSPRDPAHPWFIGDPGGINRHGLPSKTGG